MDDGIEHEASPELIKFLSEPMSRGEVIQLVQPLRSALIPIFHGVMTSLALTAIHTDNANAKEKATKAFEELREVFKEVDLFDERLSLLLDAKSPWVDEAEDATRE